MKFIDLKFEENETKNAFIVTRCLSENKCIYIPDEIAGKPVIGFSSTFKLNDYNKVIVLGKHMDSISDDILNEGNELTVYSYNDLKDNSHTEDITIRANLESIYEDMDVIFGLFGDKTAYVIDNQIVDSMKIGFGTWGRLIVIPTMINDEYKVVGIGNHAFSNAINLKKILLPETIKWIGKFAFENCYKLEDIALNSDILCIDDFSFSRCHHLGRVEINGNVEYMGKNILNDSFRSYLLFNQLDTGNFNNNWNLQNRPVYYGFVELLSRNELIYALFNDFTAVIISNQLSKHTFLELPERVVYMNQEYLVKEIAPYAFYKCVNLFQIEIPFSISKIHAYAFSGTLLREVTLPHHMEYIGEGIFANSILLESIVMPINIEFIPKNFSNNCQSLHSVTLPDNVKVICESAFQGCSKLTNMSLPSSLEVLESMCLYDTDLPLIILGQNVKKVEDLALACNNTLESIVFMNSNCIIGENSLSSDRLIKIYIAGPEENHLALVLHRTYGKKINIFTEVEKTIVDHGIIYLLNEFGAAIVIGHQDESLNENAVIKAQIEGNNTIKVDRKAFYNSRRLKNLYIPDGVTELNPYFIQNCYNLQKVSIPDSFKHTLASWYPGSHQVKIEIRSKKVTNDNKEIEVVS